MSKRLTIQASLSVITVMLMCVPLSVVTASTASIAYTAPSEDTITVNGLTTGKAALMIGGGIHLLSVGQTVANVKLISADEYSALLEIDGVAKRYYLHETKLSGYSDDFISFTSNETNEQNAILNDKPHGVDHRKSQIFKIQPIEQFSDKVRFQVEYFYNSSHGEHATLKAVSMHQGQSSGYSAHSYTKLNVGRNIVEIDVFMNPNAPDAYRSDAIQFDMIGGESHNGSYQVMREQLSFDKQWLRAESAPLSQTGVVGNAQWKVVSQSQ